MTVAAEATLATSNAANDSTEGNNQAEQMAHQDPSRELAGRRRGASVCARLLEITGRPSRDFRQPVQRDLRLARTVDS